jgi:hypothetical protein
MTKRSLPTALVFLLDTAWWAVALFSAIAIVLILWGANVALRIDFDGPSVDAGPAAAMSIPVFMKIDARAIPVRAPSLGIDDGRLQEVRGVVRFPVRRGALFAATVAIVILSFALLLWALDQLRGFFRTLRDGQPFVAANASRLRRVGWAVIAGELGRAAVLYFESAYAMAHFSAAGLTFDARPYVNVLTIVNGLIILAIAEAFSEGTRLDEDRSLTI